jgi:cell division protein FtsB
VAALVAAMAGFAVWGGEYGTGDLRALRRQVRDERARIGRLRLEIDSLEQVERLLRTDSATQERVAREVFGMIREGELLYQVVPPDSSRRDRNAARGRLTRPEPRD